MSKNNELLLALIGMLMDNKGQTGDAATQDGAPAVPLSGFGAEPAGGTARPLLDNEPGPDGRPRQGAGHPKTPPAPFSWEAEERIAITPGEHRPIGKGHNASQPMDGWPTDRRFGQCGQRFSNPQYGRRRDRNGRCCCQPGYNPYANPFANPFNFGEGHPGGDEPAGDGVPFQGIGQGSRFGPIGNNARSFGFRPR